MMRDELEHTMMRHKLHDNIDGTGEMFMGLMLLGFALLGYLQTILPEDSIWRTNFFFGLLFMYAVMILVLGSGNWLRRVIKRRITFPRAGYVAFHSFSRLVFMPKQGKSEVDPGPTLRRSFWVWVLAFALIMAVLGAGGGFLAAKEILAAKQSAPSLVRVAYLVFWVPIYGFWVYRMGQDHRWKWLVLLLMAIGLAAIGLLVPGGFIELSKWVMLFVGLMWFMSGGATLCSFLRHTHPRNPVTE